MPLRLAPTKTRLMVMICKSRLSAVFFRLPLNPYNTPLQFMDREAVMVWT
jgi:hypothetical protein